MVHITTRTTIYKYAAGTKENRTIMRADLVVIHTALATFAKHDWLGIFTDSMSNLHNANPDIRSSLHYHHHMLLLESITDLLETRRRLSGFHTTLHKLRAHTNIRGNDLADAAAKLVVRNFDTLPPAQSPRVGIREIAPHPSHWVMYTATPLRPDSALSAGSNRATLRRPWWVIPEADRLQMHAFALPSQQLRLKV